MDSILNQTYKNWECIVIDGYSTDSTVEYIKERTIGDERFKIFQYPAKGVYDAWNKGIKHTKGEYIYIATSDDTMINEALEVLYNGLKLNPNCKIAHSKLTVIDDQSIPVTDKYAWNNYRCYRFFSNEFDNYHIRKTGLDFKLFGFSGNIYTSFTQLLIHHSLFRAVGPFPIDKGSVGDFVWLNQAVTLTETLHIPENLATWRIHKNQATQNSLLDTEIHKEFLCKALKRAYVLAVKNNIIKPSIFQRYLFLLPYRREQFYISYYKRNTKVKQEKLKFYIKWLFKRPEIVFLHKFNNRFLKHYESPFDVTRAELLKQIQILDDRNLKGH